MANSLCGASSSSVIDALLRLPAGSRTAIVTVGDSDVSGGRLAAALVLRAVCCLNTVKIPPALLLASPFTATAGQPLSFRFNNITSDGSSTFPDYAFVRLVGGTEPILLFTAQTPPSGNTVPGFALPTIAPGVTPTPSATPIIATGYAPPEPGPVFGPLGERNGLCFYFGCGIRVGSPPTTSSAPPTPISSSSGCST